MKQVLFSTSAIVALSLGGTALAQQGEDSTRSEEAQSGQEDVITVYGTTNPLPVFDYPGQVTVISREEISLRSPSTASDVLRDVPGVEFSGGPRRTGETPSIRGRGGENVLILLDGARQSFISAHDGRFFLDPDLIRTAEVVRGPASSLYGSGAVGGVLAFESVDAADLLRDGETAGVRLRFGYQDVNEETLATITGFTKQGALDLVGSVGKRDSSDIELGSGADLPSDDDITTLLLKASYALTDALTIEGSWQRFDNTAFEPNNGQGVGTGGGTGLAADVEKEIVTDTYRFSAEFDPDTNDWVDASITLYNTQTEVEEFDESLPRLATREIETTGLTLRNASRFTVGGVETVLTLGADFYEDEQTGLDDNTPDGTRGGVPNGSAEFMGLFAQLEATIDQPFGLPGDLLIIPGIRFDSFESEAPGISAQKNDDDATSPRIAASYGPNDWLRVFVSYSEGFRAPSVNELFLDGVHFPVPHPVLFDPAAFQFVFVNNNFIPNPDLTPEESATTEVGLGLDFDDVFTSGDRFQAKASYYTSDVEDLINLSVNFAFDPTCFAPPFFLPCTAGTTNSANVDEAELDGFELEASYDAPRWFIRTSYSSIDGEDKSDGSDLGVLTPDRLAIDARWKLTEWNAAIGTRLQIADDFERRQFNTMTGSFDLAEQRDGYEVVDLYATWQPGFAENLRLDIGVDNVFDENYERVFAGVSEPARNFKISATWRTGY